MDGDRATVALAAQALHTAARGHKREAEHHRRQARKLARQLDELRSECAKRGISLVIDTAPKEAQS
jgi:hypothetical protein